MSKDKEFQLSIVKMAQDITYEKPDPPNNLVKKEEYDKANAKITELNSEVTRLNNLNNELQNQLSALQN